MEIDAENPYIDYHLNEVVRITKRFDQDGSENRYGIILDNIGEGLIEFNDDEADLACNYEFRHLNNLDKFSKSYKMFITNQGLEPFTPIPVQQTIRLF